MRAERRERKEESSWIDCPCKRRGQREEREREERRDGKKWKDKRRERLQKRCSARQLEPWRNCSLPRSTRSPKRARKSKRKRAKKSRENTRDRTDKKGSLRSGTAGRRRTLSSSTKILYFLRLRGERNKAKKQKKKKKREQTRTRERSRDTPALPVDVTSQLSTREKIFAGGSRSGIFYVESDLNSCHERSFSPI